MLSLMVAPGVNVADEGQNMRQGMSPKEAALDALKRVARNFDNDPARLAAIDLNFYALSKTGEYCGASLWNKRTAAAARGATFTVCQDQGESKREVAA